MSEKLQWLLTLANSAQNVFEIFGKMGASIPQPLKERLPLFLNLSLEDERRMGRLLAQLESDERKSITDFLDSLEDFQKKLFRYVVVGIPEEKKRETKTGAGTKLKVETEFESYALKFLKIIAEVVLKDGTSEAKRQCLAGGIITQDTFSQKMIEKWRGFVRWVQDNGPKKVEKMLINFFGVESISDITPEKIIEKAKILIAEANQELIKAGNYLLTPLEEYVAKRQQRPWYKKIFWA